MKVYLVKPYYKYDGGNPRTIKAFLDESLAYYFKEDLDMWKEREPQCFDLVVNYEAGAVTDEEWEEFDKGFEMWQDEFEGVPVFSDGFVIEEVEVEE